MANPVPFVLKGSALANAPASVPEGITMSPQQAGQEPPTQGWWPGMGQNTANLRGQQKPFAPIARPPAPFRLR